MWGRKKPDERQAAKPEPKYLLGHQPPKPPAASLQETSQVNKEALGPRGAMMGSVAARLSAALHVKGEITGSEDLVIEGTFEGIVDLDERKLTIGTTAKVTADIVAGEGLPAKMPDYSGPTCASRVRGRPAACAQVRTTAEFAEQEPWEALPQAA